MWKNLKNIGKFIAQKDKIFCKRFWHINKIGIYCNFKWNFVEFAQSVFEIGKPKSR